MKKILLPALLALLLSACASSPPSYVRSAWYLQSASGTMAPRETPKLYLALLNTGSSPLDVQSVNINGSGMRELDGWRWGVRPGKSSALILEPGRLATMPASEFWRSRDDRLESFDQACQLPVEVRLWIDGGAVGQAMLRTELLGQMPSTLPAGWAEACRPPAS